MSFLFEDQDLTFLQEYDWLEAFAYAGEPNRNGSPNLMGARPGRQYNLEPFGVAEVAQCFARVEGENEGPPWIIAGQTKDGRYFYLEAGCDYTGWDSIANGSCTIANSYEELVHFGMTKEAREAFFGGEK